MLTRPLQHTCVLALSLCSLTLCACSASRTSGEPQVVAKASEQQRKNLLDQVKTLAGEWETTGPNGKKQLTSVFTVTSGGACVREVMMPGTPHEMTNMYHMDGDALVMTHYCAAGNQPRMRAKAGQPGTIAFTFESVTDYNPGETCMADVTMTWNGPDKLKVDWRTFAKESGKLDDHAIFELTRRK